MANLSELRQLLLQKTLERYEGEYEELLENWRDLERKAQLTITIASAFLAGIFAFVRAGSSINPDVKIFLILAIILLLPTLLCALFVFSIKERYIAPSGDTVREFAIELINHATTEPDLEERVPDFLNEVIRQWEEVNENLLQLNSEKAAMLLKSHICLIATMFVLLLDTVIFILSI